jgi:hypothetical protein
MALSDEVDGTVPEEVEEEEDVYTTETETAAE